MAVLVIGLLPSLDRASLCLTNLAEADFDAANISIVTESPDDAARIGNVGGPLAGANVENLAARLAGLGLPAEAAALYQQGVVSGKVFIAIATPDAADAAAEMLGDSRADAVRIFREG
ncbi:MAG TPA: hypothetical protein VMW65_05540 [Chloroflexota bacterium]|nr:hypothetical protein [Chloroflexota bacterium]